jgi:hypothetical protein
MQNVSNRKPRSIADLAKRAKNDVHTLRFQAITASNPHTARTALLALRKDINAAIHDVQLAATA